MFAISRIFSFIIYVRCATSLFCYSCYGESMERNWKCNEAEPTLCKGDEVCIVANGTALFKRCSSTCPKSRSDREINIDCRSCDKNLCNGPIAEDKESQAKTPKRSVQASDGSRYVLFFRPSTFWKARLECSAKGGKLATVESAEKQAFIWDKFLNQTKSRKLLESQQSLTAGPQSDVEFGSFWIGARKYFSNESDVIGTWIWTDHGYIIPTKKTKCVKSELTEFENWDDDHPKPSSRFEQLCCSMTRYGLWQSVSCGYLLPAYLCEFPKRKPPQSAMLGNYIYMYHSSKVRWTKPQIICNHSGAEVAVPDQSVVNLFNYISNYSQVWTGAECGDLGSKMFPDHVSEEKVPACTGRRAFICKQPLKPEIECITSQQREETTQSSTLSSILSRTSNTQPPVENANTCGEYEQIGIQNDSIWFPNTSLGSFAYSSEKCPDGRSKASIYCRRPPKFDPKSFTMVPCHLGMSDLNQIYSDESLLSADTEYRDILQLLRILTSESAGLTPSNISSAIGVLYRISQEKTEISKEDLKNAVTVAGHAHEFFRKTFFKSNPDVSAEEKIILGESIESLAGSVSLEKEESGYRFHSHGIEVEVQKMNSSSFESVEEDITFTLGDNSYSSLTIPSSSVIGIMENDSESFNETDEASNRTELRAVFVAYRSHELFPTDEDIQVGQVLSATVTDGRTKLSVPIQYSMQISTDLNTSQTECVEKECKYYEPTLRKWIGDGCQRVKTSNKVEDVVNCKCDHTTSFAVVISRYAEENYALDIVSTVGLIVSIVCLVMTILLFIISPELRRVRSAPTHKHLCGCLATAYLIFLIGIEKTDNRPLCAGAAASIHFFLLAAWGWMVLESVSMYRMFVRTFERRGAVDGAKMALAVYIAAAFVAMATMGLSVLAEYIQETPDGDCKQNDLWSSYIGEDYCWLHGYALYGGFLLLVGFALTFNVTLSALIIRAITWKRSTVHSSNEEKPFIHVLRAVLVALLLGVAWVFAIPLVVSRDAMVQEVFGWLFAVTIFAQGVFIFYFFCLRRKDVRSSWLCLIKGAFNPQKGGEDTIARFAKNEKLHQNSSATNEPKTLRTFTPSCTSEPKARSYSSVKSPEKNVEKPDTEQDGNKAPQHSTDLVGFSGEEVFES